MTPYGHSRGVKVVGHSSVKRFNLEIPLLISANVKCRAITPLFVDSNASIPYQDKYRQSASRAPSL